MFWFKFPKEIVSNKMDVLGFIWESQEYNFGRIDAILLVTHSKISFPCLDNNQHYLSCLYLNWTT